MSPDPIRNASFDYARLLAVCGIVWFHAQAPGAGYGYAGLSFFLILLMFLAVPQIQAIRRRRHRAPTVLRYAAGRGRRLILPWVLASGLYGGFKLIEVSQGAAFDTEFTPIMWLTGTALHLWFLPYAFVICMLVWPLGRALQHASTRIRLHAGVASAGGALAALAFWQTAALPVPVAQWAYALPAVLLGLALACTGGRILPMLALSAFFFVCALSANWTTGLLQLGLATGLLLLCTLLPTPGNAVSGFCARSSYGIYLIHPAILTILTRSELFAPQSTLLAVVTCAMSAAIVAAWETLRKPRNATPSSSQHGPQAPLRST